MSNVINLNQVRKTKARAEKRAQADENAVRHGRSKADKALDTARADQDRSRLDAHEREEE